MPITDYLPSSFTHALERRHLRVAIAFEQLEAMLHVAIAGLADGDIVSYQGFRFCLRHHAPLDPGAMVLVMPMSAMADGDEERACREMLRHNLSAPICKGRPAGSSRPSDSRRPQTPKPHDRSATARNRIPAIPRCVSPAIPLIDGRSGGRL